MFAILRLPSHDQTLDFIYSLHSCPMFVSSLADSHWEIPPTYLPTFLYSL